MSRNSKIMIHGVISRVKINSVLMGVIRMIKLRGTVCPKVPLKRNLVVFSTINGWILKPFELQTVLECGFDMMYNRVQ